jgi:hypothetical protein
VTTNLQYVRDFPVAYDILFENISDQVCLLVHSSLHCCQALMTSVCAEAVARCVPSLPPCVLLALLQHVLSWTLCAAACSRMCRSRTTASRTRGAPRSSSTSLALSDPDPHAAVPCTTNGSNMWH